MEGHMIYFKFFATFSLAFALCKTLIDFHATKKAELPDLGVLIVALSAFFSAIGMAVTFLSWLWLAL